MSEARESHDPEASYATLKTAYKDPKGKQSKLDAEVYKKEEKGLLLERDVKCHSCKEEVTFSV
jgi:hypothetical protein